MSSLEWEVRSVEKLAAVNIVVLPSPCNVVFELAVMVDIGLVFCKINFGMLVEETPYDVQGVETSQGGVTISTVILGEFQDKSFFLTSEIRANPERSMDTRFQQRQRIPVWDVRDKERGLVGDLSQYAGILAYVEAQGLQEIDIQLCKTGSCSDVDSNPMPTTRSVSNC